MRKMKRYVENFLKANGRNENYQIYTSEMTAVYDAIKTDPFNAIGTLFDYDYAKGYRAAMAELRKGGAAV